MGAVAGNRTVASLVTLLALTAAACSTSAQSSAPPSTTGAASTAAPTTESVSTTTTTLPPTTTVPETTTTVPETRTTTTTTTTLPPLDVYDPECVVQVQEGESLTLIVERRSDYTIDVETVAAENGLEGDLIYPDQLLDVCVDNGLDDITGEVRTERNAVVVQREVMAQQAKLNELFDGLGFRELLVDGISGPVTRQRLCAFRLAHGLPVSTEDMEPGSEEEAVLMAATDIPIPFTSAILAERWVLIDRTCQVMFAGEGTERLVFVFPVSTGEPGYETRDQERSMVSRYNPAVDNGGWHNSSIYPVAEDNPLNGNMYKPLYFDRGQAIHGANNVPTSPASKGCVRMRVENQDALLYWLGLGDSPTTSVGRINLAVNVQGEFVFR
jgi:hypothetical protein